MFKSSNQESTTRDYKKPTALPLFATITNKGFKRVDERPSKRKFDSSMIEKNLNEDSFTNKNDALCGLAPVNFKKEVEKLTESVPENVFGSSQETKSEENTLENKETPHSEENPAETPQENKSEENTLENKETPHSEENPAETPQENKSEENHKAQEIKIDSKLSKNIVASVEDNDEDVEKNMMLSDEDNELIEKNI